MLSPTKVRLLITAAVLIAAWWLFCFSCNPEYVASSIPARAQFLSVHDGLGTRWKDVCDSMFVDVLSRTTGQKKEMLAERTWLARCFLNQRTLVAFVPGYSGQGGGSWVLSTWGGGYNQVLRMFLSIRGRSLGLSRHTMTDRTPYWSGRFRGGEFSLAVRGGLLMAASGRNSGILEEMVVLSDTWTRKAEPKPVRIMRILRRDFPSSKDAAWASTGNTAAEDAGVRIGVGGSAGDGVCRVLLKSGVMLPAEMGDAVDIAAGSVGDTLDAVFVSRWSNVRGLLQAQAAQLENSAVMEFLNRSVDGSSVFLLGIMNRDFSGKIYNLKIPVFLMAVQAKPGADVTEGVLGLMDRLNAESGLGIIPIKVPTEGEPVIVAGGSKMNLFGSVKERPAVAVKNGWIFLCSDMQSLLGVMDRQGGSSEVETARWASSTSASDLHRAVVYIDFESSEQAIRNAIAVYTLYLIAEGEATESKRAVLDSVRALIESMASSGEVTALMDAGAGDIMVDIQKCSAEDI